MNERDASSAFHSHAFLGAGHEKSERKTWAVIWLCGADDDRRNCRRPALRLHRTRRRRAAYEHARERAPARGPRLHLCAKARGRPDFHFWNGQTGRSRRIYERDHSGDDRAADRL